MGKVVVIYDPAIVGAMGPPHLAWNLEVKSVDEGMVEAIESYRAKLGQTGTQRDAGAKSWSAGKGRASHPQNHYTHDLLSGGSRLSGLSVYMVVPILG